MGAEAGGQSGVGDGERAVPHAWRGEHGASHARGFGTDRRSQDDARALRYGRCAEAVGAALCPDADHADRADRRGDAVAGVFAGRDGGAVGHGTRGVAGAEASLPGGLRRAEREGVLRQRAAGPWVGAAGAGGAGSAWDARRGCRGCGGAAWTDGRAAGDAGAETASHASWRVAIAAALGLKRAMAEARRQTRDTCNDPIRGVEGHQTPGPRNDPIRGVRGQTRDTRNDPICGVRGQTRDTRNDPICGAGGQTRDSRNDPIRGAMVRARVAAARASEAPLDLPVGQCADDSRAGSWSARGRGGLGAGGGGVKLGIRATTLCPALRPGARAAAGVRTIGSSRGAPSERGRWVGTRSARTGRGLGAGGDEAAAAGGIGAARQRPYTRFGGECRVGGWGAGCAGGAAVGLDAGPGARQHDAGPDLGAERGGGPRREVWVGGGGGLGRATGGTAGDRGDA